MTMIRDVPLVSDGGPDDYLGVIVAALGADHTPDSRYAFESRIRHLTVTQLRAIAADLAAAPFDVKPALAFERSLANVQAPAPVI